MRYPLMESRDLHERVEATGLVDHRLVLEAYRFKVAVTVTVTATVTVTVSVTVTVTVTVTGC